MSLHTSGLDKLAAQRAKLILEACGPDRDVTPDRFVIALCTPTAELSGEASVLFDVAATSGPGGDGPEGIRCRKDAARILYHTGAWREFERLAQYDAEVRALCAFEIHHAGRQRAEAALFAHYGPSGPQLDPPPLANT